MIWFEFVSDRGGTTPCQHIAVLDANQADWWIDTFATVVVGVSCFNMANWFDNVWLSGLETCDCDRKVTSSNPSNDSMVWLSGPWAGPLALICSRDYYPCFSECMLLWLKASRKWIRCKIWLYGAERCETQWDIKHSSYDLTVGDNFHLTWWGWMTLMIKQHWVSKKWHSACCCTLSIGIQISAYFLQDSTP